MSKKAGKSFILQDRKNTIDMNNYSRVLSSIRINKEKVLDYQEYHIKKIIYSLVKNRISIDSSDTGTGKTYCCLAVCRELRLRPFIVCPKPVISSWKKACDFYNIKPLCIVNYDTLRTGKIIDDLNDKVPSEYIKLTNAPIETKKKEIPIDTKVITIKTTKKLSVDVKNRYVWNLPDDVIIIFDEAHKCKNPESLNSKLLVATKEIKNKVLLLSATLVDKIENFSVYGYLLGFEETIGGMKRLMSNYSNANALSLAIHNMIFPEYCARIRISDLPKGVFPDNQIIPECFYMNAEISKEINNLYNEIHKGMNELKNKEIKDKGGILSKILRMRQQIELKKLPTIFRLLEDHLENNFSVVIFLNYNESISILAKYLNTKSIIWGHQTTAERDQVVADFQADKSRYIIVNANSGGTGISLHDLNGKYRRASLISPSYSLTCFVQVLGRIHRSGAKTPSLQRIIYCSGTIEEKICSVIKGKLNSLSLLNDGVLSGIGL